MNIIRFNLNFRYATAQILLLLGGLMSCNSDDETPIDPTSTMPTPTLGVDLEVKLNPSGVAPLTALIQIDENTSSSIRTRLVGRNGPESDIIREYDNLGQKVELPILGLYPNYENTVELTFLNDNGVEVGKETTNIQTTPSISDLPVISIDRRNMDEEIKPGFNLVNYFGHNGEFLPQRVFMFDEYGYIRWYLNYRQHPILGNLFYDNGLIMLKNGNFIFGDGSSGALYEIDRFGEILNTWSLKGFGFHHTLIEKPNGNFLVTVNGPSKPTSEDVIIEIDRNTGEIANQWDLDISLDKTRRTWTQDRNDWFHANGIAYDAANDGIIISGRTQGVVKLDANNNVIWVMAPHKGWEVAGNGLMLNQFLLQPLNSDGLPITDSLVLIGEENHPDFEWNWYQHSPIIMPNGNLMIFDNGENRNFRGLKVYSRAVEYKIDDEAKTIQQVWSYGKNRGSETYSRIVSKVIFHETEDNVLFTPGAAFIDGSHRGKVVEVDYTSQNVLFEATITPPRASFEIVFHNVHRMPLYPN